MQLEFNVNHQIIKRIDNLTTVAKSQKFIKLCFKFTDDWNDVKKWCYFKPACYPVTFRSLLINDACYIPYIATGYKSFEIWLAGVNYEQNTLITTSPVSITSLRPGDVEGAIPVIIQDVEDLIPAIISEIKSDTLAITKQGNIAQIEIPNIYTTDIIYNENTSKLEIYGRDNQLLSTIVLPFKDIFDGTKVVRKAQQDKDGNEITTTYLRTDTANLTYLTKKQAEETYLNKEDAIETYLNKEDANNDFLKKVDAATLYLTLENAQQDYLTKASASSTYSTKAEAQQEHKAIQDQIDAIKSKSDVVDVVGTKAELNSYDTSKLDDNDIIKVLKDESQEDDIAYYRWKISLQKFELIGTLTDSYSKEAADEKFATNTGVKTLEEKLIENINELEETLTGSIDDETERAELAEQGLRETLNTEIQTREQQDQAISERIGSEETRAKGEEQNLNLKIESEVSTRASEDARVLNEAKAYTDEFGGKIDIISRNGVTLPIVAKKVDIRVPTKTSELTNDSDFTTNEALEEVENTIIERIEDIEEDYLTSTDRQDLQDQIDINVEEIQNISKDYLKASDKNELQKAISDEQTRAEGIENSLGTRLSSVESKIPTQATPTNQLADKDFVNSSIDTASATHRGTFRDVNLLKATYGNKNDYAYLEILNTDGTIKQVDKYTHDETEWGFAYTLNNSGYTMAQWKAINSNATSENIEQITLNKNTIESLGVIDSIFVPEWEEFFKVTQLYSNIIIEYADVHQRDNSLVID